MPASITRPLAASLLSSLESADEYPCTTSVPSIPLQRNAASSQRTRSGCQGLRESIGLLLASLEKRLPQCAALGANRHARADVMPPEPAFFRFDHVLHAVGR